MSSRSASALCTRQAVLGITYSPEEVATITQPISDLSRPLSSSAFLAASIASVVVLSPSPQKWRWRMPVRVVIHSSLVST